MMATQTDMILEALQEGRRITPLEALNEMGCMRLAARIAELRTKGHDIQTEKYVTPSGKSVARYFLVTREEQAELF